MEKFQLGDIVRVKWLDSRIYFMVTDIADFTEEGDTKPDIECEIMRVYPVLAHESIDMVDQDGLILVAKYNSKDYDMIMEHITKEREQRNLFGEPEYIKRIKLTNGEFKAVQPPAIIEIKKPTFDEREIVKILADDTAEKTIEVYVKKLDTHLGLLHKALEDHNQDEIDFQKSQLEKVRQTLMELEYFQMAQRRNGTSIKIK